MAKLLEILRDDSVNAVVMAAALGAIGFVIKSFAEWVVALRATERARRARLVTLLSLLFGSRAVYRVQAHLRNRLDEHLRTRGIELTNAGYEAIFTGASQQMTDRERELHTIIRGYTINGLKPLNQAMLEWLRNDTEFKTPRTRRPDDVELARALVRLEPHLLLWLAKYESWIPTNDHHALVYLDDESKHGVPFPRGIEELVQRVVGRAADAVA